MTRAPYRLVMPITKHDWTFAGTWPYAPRWFDTPDGKMHYIDEGSRDGDPVVLVHGNPTWGYLYRNFVPALVAAGHRVIVPDLLGFGRSDKPDARETYSIERHAKRLEMLLESMNLQNATVGVHDWGGPIGLYWATRHAARIRSLVILNSFSHRPLGNVPLALPLRLFRIRGVGEWLVKGLNLIVKAFLFGAGTLDHKRLTPIVRAAYLAPHRGWSDRTSLLTFARQFPNTPKGITADFVDAVHAGLKSFSAHPVWIAWGQNDAVFSMDALARWQKDFPRAKVVRLPNTGHFLQEDAHEKVVPALVRFLKESKTNLAE